MVAGIVADLTDWLDRVSSHWWFLVIIVVIAFLDSVIPVVPSETCVIIGGVAASQGTPEPADRHRHRGARRLPRRQRRIPDRHAGQCSVSTAEPNGGRGSPRRWRGPVSRSIERGGLLLITARFIPGGRTALTLSCGITRQRRAWFMRWVVVATVIWASYAALLGRIGGEAFKDDHTKAFLMAFGLAIATNIAIEVTRHY